MREIRDEFMRQGYDNSLKANFNLGYAINAYETITEINGVMFFKILEYYLSIRRSLRNFKHFGSGTTKD